jgi:nucleotide-binding universal stress UspA family protein
MSTILVGVGIRGRPDDATELGRRLADALATSLTLVHVFPYEDYPMRQPVPQFEQALHDLALEDVRKAAATLRWSGPTELDAIGRSSAAAGLHDLAVAKRATAIVIGPTHHKRAGRALLGSTAHRLLHGAPCPVAVAPVDYVEHASDLRSILVAYDGSSEAHAGLDLAARLARATGASLRLVAVLAPLTGAEAGAWPAFGFADIELNRREGLQAELDRAIDELPPDVQARRELLEGAPGHVLEKCSAGCDLMVCGSRGYGPVGSVLLGSVSQHIVHHVKCPLLVIPRVGVAAEAPAADVGARAALA